MDRFLASIYGTGQDSDLEKVADYLAEGIEELCKQAGVDPNDVSDAELQQILAGAVQELSEQTEKTAALEEVEVLNEAGRLLARSLFGLEKTAAEEKAEKAVKEGKKLKEKIKDFLKAIGRVYSGKYSKEMWAKGGKWAKTKAIGAPVLAYGIPSAAIATGIGLGVRGKRKKSSLSEDEIQQTAYDLLKQAGWVDNNGEPLPPEVVNWVLQKQAEEEAKKEEGKEEEKEEEEEKKEAALDYLEALGYPVITK